MSIANGVEFLEFDVAGERERAELHGQANAVGYHGNARIGGRCAVLAQLRMSSRDLTFAAVHLDSHGSPRIGPPRCACCSMRSTAATARRQP